MALSMDEQRVLAEIERRLAADDPGLATCLTSFRRIIGSLFTVLLVTMVSLMVYAMIPFRAHATRTPAPSASTHGAVASAAASASLGSRTTPSVNAGAGAGTAARSSGKSATPSPGASASTRSTQGARSQSAPTATGP
jgi:hypothetical protein